MPETRARVTVTSPQTRATAARARRRGVTEVREHTAVGEVLVESLVRAQLALALRVLAVFATVFGGLPLLFALAPGLAEAELLGIRLPWVLLGFLAFPLVAVLGWLYVQRAERNEAEFTEVLDR